MHRIVSFGGTAALLALAGACDGYDDGGYDYVSDNGADDAATPDDAGVDDAGAVDDAGLPDGVDDGATDEATGTLCAAAYAGCTTWETPGGAPTVTFASFSYSPKCLRITPGQSVTFSGSFATHPLAQSCGPADVMANGSGGSAAFTFDAPGVYGYHCSLHGSAAGAGMAGAILVDP